MSRYLQLVNFLYLGVSIASVSISPQRISQDNKGETEVKYGASETTFLVHYSWTLKVEPFFCVSAHGSMACALECRKRDLCSSFNFAVHSRTKNCELLQEDKYTSPDNFQPSPPYHDHYSKISPCEYNPCKDDSTTCRPLYRVNGFLCEVVEGQIKRAASWFKLSNKSVCFGAKNDSFGIFKVPQNGTILTFKLVYKSGYVTCNSKNTPYGSHWACNNQKKIGTIITNAENKVIFPHNYKNTSFMLSGYHRNSSKLIYHLSPQMVYGGEEFRIWYHEDYRNQNEYDNAGSTCTDVYALYN